MLERITSPENVLAFRAVGKIEASDYVKTLDPAVEQMLSDKGEVRFVYVIGDDFDAYSAGAAWEDTKLGLSHPSKWKKVAIVTNHDWVRHVVGMFGWMVPGEVKTFPLADEANAIAWASG